MKCNSSICGVCVGHRQSILADKLDLTHSTWSGISNDAKDFIACLLHKDPAQRPSAKDALKHPWLRKGTVSERLRGKPLSLAVVQRIQVLSLNMIMLKA